MNELPTKPKKDVKAYISDSKSSLALDDIIGLIQCDLDLIKKKVSIRQSRKDFLIQDIENTEILILDAEFKKLDSSELKERLESLKEDWEKFQILNGMEASKLIKYGKTLTTIEKNEREAELSDMGLDDIPISELENQVRGFLERDNNER